MANDNLKQYKNYPFGSAERRAYDSEHLPYQEYLDSYYAKADLSNWNLWMNKYVNPAFDQSKREKLVALVQKDKGPLLPDFEKMERAYELILTDDRFENDIKRFIAYLVGTGFLEKFNLNLNDWLNLKNWSNPLRTQFHPDTKTILENASYKNGMNFLRVNFPLMDWWKP